MDVGEFGFFGGDIVGFGGIFVLLVWVFFLFLLLRSNGLPKKPQFPQCVTRRTNAVTLELGLLFCAGEVHG